ncbi:unnamed protein product [Brassica oleracea var. botrytis]
MCDAGNPGDPAEASTFLTRTAPPISGVHANKVITGGIVHLQVQYGYKTIMDHTYNLSELITCPFSPGAVVLSFRKQFPYAKELMTPMIYLNLIEEPHEEEIMCLVFCYDTSSSGVVFA